MGKYIAILSIKETLVRFCRKYMGELETNPVIKIAIMDVMQIL
jgi:hypothetical protein